MNIKQAADASGVSARNIRYYEQAELLNPARNPENDYRIYTDADVRTLKLIRMLRTLDMPVEDIRAVLAGTLPLARAAAAQQKRLQTEREKLAAAENFCKELADGGKSAAAQDMPLWPDKIVAGIAAAAVIVRVGVRAWWLYGNDRDEGKWRR